MDRLYYRTINLETLRAQVQFYSRELRPVMQSCLTQSEHDAVRLVYQRLNALHACMARDLAEIEMLLERSSGQSDLAEAGSGGDDSIRLSCKEIEVLNMFARGYSYSEAAALLGCKLSMIQTHAKHIYRKLQVHSRSETVFEARQLGLVHG